MTQDELFREAVAAIDTGDVALLKKLIDANPQLVSERLEKPGAWLSNSVGDALNGFFERPYLLWFTNEDAVRAGSLPPNIVELTRTIIDAARAHNVPSLQEQLDYALRLTSWSGVAAKCGVQLEMIDALIEAGASPADEVNNALVNGHTAAAERLLDHGATLTFAAALCLERWDDVERMFSDTNHVQRQFAFVLAALNGRAAALEWMVDHGVKINEPSGALYSHGTPLHHAVCSGSIEAVKALVERGADVNAVDTAWNGTPLGWAWHYVEEPNTERPERYREIALYLQARGR